MVRPSALAVLRLMTPILLAGIDAVGYQAALFGELAGLTPALASSPPD
jgi:hypothetical protein